LSVGADVFLDTNILIFAAQGRVAAPDEFEVARRIVVEEKFATSAQVLAEFFFNVINKGVRPLTSEKAAEWVQTIAGKPCQAVDARLVASGIEISQRYQLSFWDGAIIGAAERLGTKVVYTEDFNNGQIYGSVRVVNPFLTA